MDQKIALEINTRYCF